MRLGCEVMSDLNTRLCAFLVASAATVHLFGCFGYKLAILIKVLAVFNLV